VVLFLSKEDLILFTLTAEDAIRIQVGSRWSGPTSATTYQDQDCWLILHILKAGTGANRWIEGLMRGRNLLFGHCYADRMGGWASYLHIQTWELR